VEVVVVEVVGFRSQLLFLKEESLKPKPEKEDRLLEIKSCILSIDG
jgi:hypothetical protein